VLEAGVFGIAEALWSRTAGSPGRVLLSIAGGDLVEGGEGLVQQG
jgi:hypothetical protein